MARDPGSIFLTHTMYEGSSLNDRTPEKGR